MVSVDLHGKRLQTIASLPAVDPTREADTSANRWQASPSAQHMAYMLFSGGQYYDGSEFQDLEVIRSENPAQPTRISSGRGVLSYAWSPDGKRIAYSDLDSRGIRQLYRSNADGTDKAQLTHFTEVTSYPVPEYRGNHMGTPIWSPDGEFIAISYGVTDATGVTTATLWLVSTQEDRQREIYRGSQSLTTIMGWEDDSSVLAYYVEDDKAGTRGFRWVLAGDGTVVRALDTVYLPGTKIALVAAVRGVRDWLGIDGDGALYPYDMLTSRLDRTTLAAPWIEKDFIVGAGGLGSGELILQGQLMDARVSPAAFSGEDACEQAARP